MTKTLLSIGGDAKTRKGEKSGYLTGIMYLTPYTGGGKNLCAMAAINKCHEACLYTAGRGKLSSVHTGRLRRTTWYNEDPRSFMQFLIAKEIPRLLRTAERAGMTPMVRLNGTSDIVWERKHPEVFEAFPDVQFYDYTKIPTRGFDLPPNYHLTWSYSGANPRADEHMEAALHNGINVAVVFRKDKPATWRGFPVIDGDENDLRSLDPFPVIVGLKAKGDAIHDTSGFVVDAEGGD